MKTNFELAEKFGFERKFRFQESVGSIEEDFYKGVIDFQKLVTHLKSELCLNLDYQDFISQNKSFHSGGGGLTFPTSKPIDNSYVVGLNGVSRKIIMDGEINKKKGRVNTVAHLECTLDLNKKIRPLEIVFKFYYDDIDDVAIKLKLFSYLDYELVSKKILKNNENEFDDNLFLLFSNLYPENNVDNLIRYYKCIPGHIIKTIEDEKLFKAIELLSDYDDDEFLSWFKDESGILIKVLLAFDSQVLFYDRLLKKQNFVKRVYYNLQGESPFDGKITPNKTIFASFISLAYGNWLDQNRNSTDFIKTDIEIGGNYSISTNLLSSDSDKVYITKQIKKEGIGASFQRFGETHDLGNETVKQIGEELEFNPLDIILYIDNGQLQAAPAIYVIDLAYHKQADKLLHAIRVWVNIIQIAGATIVIASGPGALFMTLAVADLLLASGDLAIASIEEDLKKTKEGREYLELWNNVYLPLSVATGIPTLSFMAINSVNKLWRLGKGLLKTGTELATKKYVATLLLKVSLEINAANFTGYTVKAINYAEVVTIGTTRLSTLTKTTRLQDAGVSFIQLLDEKGKVVEVVALYKTEIIARGSVKTVQETFKPLVNASTKSDLAKLLDELERVSRIRAKKAAKFTKFVKKWKGRSIKNLSKEEIIDNLNGFTLQADKVAKIIENGKMKIHILDVQSFKDTFLNKGGKFDSKSKIQAFQVKDETYFIETTSVEKFMSELVHEGTHILDDIKIEELMLKAKTVEEMEEIEKQFGNQWSSEKRAFFHERAFQIATGIGPEYKTIEKMLENIFTKYTKNY